MSSNWKLKEIVVVAMIGAVVGIVFMLWSNLYLPLTPVLGPVGIEILYGMYFLPGIMIMYIVRKPGAAVLGSLIASLISTLAGSPFGFVNVVIAGLIQGAAPEFIFFLRGYKKFDLSTMLLAGAFTAIAIFVRDFFVFGYGAFPGQVLLGMIVVRMISGALIAGLLGKFIADALHKTGVLANFSIARNE
jgi:energy-coupling factor transport system substrate-specific component